MDKIDIQKSAKIIAKALNESNKHAIQQIGQLIEVLGIDFVQANLAETLDIEVKGGMKTNDGKRRRSAGGVFFYTVKPKLSPEQRGLIFPPIDWKKRRGKKKAKGKAAKAEAKQVEATTTIASEAENMPESKPEVPSSKVLPEVADKLSKLEAAAETLRERIAEMEAKGQKGIKMTRTLLTNTENQIEKLLKEKAE